MEKKHLALKLMVFINVLLVFLSSYMSKNYNSSLLQDAADIISSLTY